MRVLFHLGLTAAVCAAVSVAGCATQSTAVDAGFGDAVTAARAAQVIDPDAPSRHRQAPRADGQAAKAAIDQYQKSFESPPPPVNVLNIGVGSGSGVSK